MPLPEYAKRELDAMCYGDPTANDIAQHFYNLGRADAKLNGACADSNAFGDLYPGNHHTIGTVRRYEDENGLVVQFKIDDNPTAFLREIFVQEGLDAAADLSRELLSDVLTNSQIVCPKCGFYVDTPEHIEGCENID